MTITLVLAANARDFEQWCHEHDVNPHSRDLVYASSPRKVEGMRGFEIVRTARWSLHPNAGRIAAIVEQNQRRWREP